METPLLLDVRPIRRVGIFFLEAFSPWWSRSQNHRNISFPNISGDPVRRVRNVSAPFCRDGFGLESIFSVPKFKTCSGSKIQKVGKRTVPQKRPQKSRPQIQKGLLNQKASGKKLSVIIIMAFITTPPRRQRQRVPWRGHLLPSSPRRPQTLGPRSPLRGVTIFGASACRGIRGLMC